MSGLLPDFDVLVPAPCPPPAARPVLAPPPRPPRWTPLTPVPNEDELVRANIGLVFAVAHRMRRAVERITRRPVDVDEVAALGMPGLLRAIRGHDASKGALSTYAFLVIRHTIQRNADLDAPLGRAAAYAERCGRALPRVVSLEAPIRGDGEEGRLGDTIAAAGADPCSVAATHERREWARELIGSLPRRHRRVVRALFFKGRSLDDVGSDMGVSPERARQIREEALTMLREAV